MVSAGVGGGITGKGANLLVIDDPFKNREESESDSHREKVWDWYRSSAYTRLEAGGAIVLMHTRWHTADLAGILLEQMKNGEGDAWTVVRLPAIAEADDPLGRRAGEALWPEKYDAEDLARIRANLGEYDWEALYQQEPFSRSGNLFRREWFVVVDDVAPQVQSGQPPTVVERVRYWDIATTAGGGAYTAGVLMGRAGSGIIYVEHVTRGQWGEYERDQQMLHTAQIDMERPGARTVIWHEQEPGSSGKDAAAARNMKLAEAGFEAHFETVTGDKVVRAGPWSSALEAGKVRLMRGGWNQAYIDEHCSFPKGRYKDQVDASDGAFAKISQGYGTNGGIHV
jgi:predicted phage terminase large subunit-like protein